MQTVTPRRLRVLKDLIVTLILWGYYTVGFVLFFAPFYAVAGLLSGHPAAAFQRYNARFYRYFFILLELLVPSCRWQVDEAVKSIRGGVIVANHVSYLDPIRLISYYPRHTTIAKHRLFHIPIYGRMLRLSGYLPSSSHGRLADVMVERMDQMPGFLAEGGNLIIFPEGTRSRDGDIGPLNRGAFKIARFCRAPIYVLAISETNRLFRPGRFLFDTCSANTVKIAFLKRIDPPYDDPDFLLADLIKQVHSLLQSARLRPGN
jgi:1-acyl-sn-glycerol-3-phosphate acyltransferase